MSSFQFFSAYPQGDFDLESATAKGIRKPKISKISIISVLKSCGNLLRYYYNLHPVLVFFTSLILGATVIVILSMHETRHRMMSGHRNLEVNSNDYPFPQLRNLVVVAGHSIYTSTSCGDVEDEGSWFLEPYQKNPGEATTFLTHIREGIRILEKDEAALLLFSGGETRKDAGPLSEAQSYWTVAQSQRWFGKGENVRTRAQTEEYARDSFENLLFSACRFRELTGTYPNNITVVSYDFKEERFVHLHRFAMAFPESKFYYVGSPATLGSREEVEKGEEVARAQFTKDPYGCQSFQQKKLRRDPFNRSIPYPSGCPEIEELFRYCGPAPYPGSLPWTYFS